MADKLTEMRRLDEGSKDGKDARFTNVQMTEEAHDVLDLLQKRYGTRSMSAAMLKFVQEHDPALAESAEKIRTIVREVEGG